PRQGHDLPQHRKDNARFAANTSGFGDPHQLPKTELTPPSALVKLTTPRGSPFFEEHAMRKILRGYAKEKMVISFLLAPRRSSLARTNVLQLRAREKDIWSGKAQQSLRKKRFVKGDDTGQQGSDHLKEDIEMISRRTTLLSILVLGSVLGARVPAFGEA